jgi:hypothetical protein
MTLFEFQIKWLDFLAVTAGAALREGTESNSPTSPRLRFLSRDFADLPEHDAIASETT